MKPISFTAPLFTFQEALTATEADKAWLRTLIQRDKKNLLGTRHRTGRLLFSLHDIIAIALLWGLNAKLRIAPSAAWQVIHAVEPILAKSRKAETEIIHIGFDGPDNLFIWTVGSDGVLATWSDHSDANMPAVFQANNEPHFVLPISSVLAPVAKATAIASDWPEDVS